MLNSCYNYRKFIIDILNKGFYHCDCTKRELSEGKMHINNDFQRISNISQAFEIIWREKEISRIDIARKLNAYRSTVSNIIDILLENKIICEGQRGEAGEKGGRKPIYLSINKAFGAIAGIELQPEFYNVVVIDFSGETIFSYSEEINFNTPEEYSEQSFITLLDSIVNPLISKVKEKGLNLLGMSLALPGIIDTHKGVIRDSFCFNLKNVDFSSIFLNRYNIPLLIENDAKCCAWLHKGQSEAVKDFICVLAREHKVEGIAVGLSVVMNNKIINGHNYAAGEYISVSWRKDKKGQTGLPEAVIKTLTSVEDSYNEWVKDLFSTLTVMIPLLEPCEIYLHGQKQEKREKILSVISQDVSQFEGAMNNYGARLIITDEDGFEIAEGAALMYLQRLFEMQFLTDDYFYSVLNWDILFNQK